MRKSDKNLLIIFGTTSGIGKALYGYASKFSENSFILSNRKSVNDSAKNICQNLTLDLSEPITKDGMLKLRGLFSRQKGYAGVYLILNASVVEPIGPIGLIGDASLVNAVNVNFANYERIINVFISATRHLRTRKKILAISSGAAASPSAGLSSYCSAKAALEMFIKCLFLEQRKGAKYPVLALRPGVVDTDMQKRIRSSEKKFFPQADAYKKLFLWRTLLKPETVARKIYLLLNHDKYWYKPVIDISEIK